MSVIPAEPKMPVSSGDVGRRNLQDALWLAGQEIRRQWLSYLVSNLYLVFLSLLTIGIGDLMAGSTGLEFVLLATTLIISTPFFARDYMNWATDPVAERLTWLRSLPIDARTIVGSRMLAMLAVAPFNIVAFFGPIYLAGAWSLDTVPFILFALSILGISLIGAGVHLCLELGVSLRRWLITNVVVLVPLVIIFVVLGWAAEIWPFAGLARSVERYGFVITLLCIAVGAIGFLALGRLAEDLLRRRELGA